MMWMLHCQWNNSEKFVCWITQIHKGTYTNKSWKEKKTRKKINKKKNSITVNIFCGFYCTTVFMAAFPTSMRISMLKAVAWISNYIPQNIIMFDYLSIVFILAVGTLVLIGVRWLHSLWLSDAICTQWSLSSLVQVTACHLCSVKPLLEPIMTYFHLMNFSEIRIKNTIFSQIAFENVVSRMLPTFSGPNVLTHWHQS